MAVSGKMNSNKLNNLLVNDTQADLLKKLSSKMPKVMQDVSPVQCRERNISISSNRQDFRKYRYLKDAGLTCRTNFLKGMVSGSLCSRQVALEYTVSP